MHGDFSLNPLAYRAHVSRVLYQMGRVQLDSDANEQAESVLRFLRGLAVDLIGFHGGVCGAFRILPDEKKSFRVAWGDYYVDGIRCVNAPAAGFWHLLVDEKARKQAGDGLPITEHEESFWEAEPRPKEKQLLYLAAWERHVSAAEVDAIREVALSGVDTTSRAVVVWQIRATPAKPVVDLAGQLKTQLKLRDPNDPAGDPNTPKIDPLYLALNLLLRSSARLRAQAVVNENMEPCIVSPEARFRGAQNRLYRVEIHQPGDAKNEGATFKWSPDNGSIVYPVRSIEKTTVFLESLGRDERTAICKNDWVEVVDDEITLRRRVHPLLQVVDVDRDRMTVTLSAEPEDNAGGRAELHPILRRWARKDRPLSLAPNDNPTDRFVELEDGIEVQFSAQDSPQGGLRTGDYWLIPARTATGDVIWPRERPQGSSAELRPRALPPHGIDEHYAPLAVWDPAGQGTFVDRRWTFDPLASPRK